MRLGSRNDLFLLIGLALALFAIVSRPLGDLLDYARDIGEGWDLELLPGLVILAAVFMIHQFRKRNESRALALTSAAEARQATARATEMERLVNFGRSLGESLDHASIGTVAAEHLPTLAEGRGAWAIALSGTTWRPLAVVADRSLAECEIAARHALGDPVAGATVPNDVCFPMIVGGQPVGVIGVAPEPPVTEHQRIALAAAAALLGGALKNAELFEVVHENSVRDALTGCFNRQHALEIIDTELRRARRSKLPLALIMFDLDHFKDINDTYGHLCGDEVLSSVGQRMKTSLRGSDVKCRWGGEEFLVLLPDTDPSGAERVAEILRHDLEEHPVKWHVADIHVADIAVTASFGLTSIVPGEMDATAIITRADAALYQAKEGGRNRVCVADSRQVTA
jgi:diguanylate cyclase (GGDEF)-like protein